ncbi:zinc metalloproteinase nas-1 isoform X1 [Drosophila ficusphila]|uniref:zinc metalloproteinase nas-1 isoform X1 n=1 Tax=Drosophila ficusphila TaxID=30025 RepID=UPI0007E77D52|nr:zinc metalloproteinase nas-1 isoform X1 [Drosophila ficusphila]
MQKSHTNTHFFLLLVLLGIFQGDSMPLEAKDSHEIIDLKERELADNLFRNPDEEITGTLAKAHNANSIQNPGEYGNYFEGDIVLPRRHRNAGAFGARNGKIDPSSHWPNGIVPYEIENSFNEMELKIIHHAFEEFRMKTCVQFKKRTTETDYVVIINGTGCYSDVGRQGLGPQDVSLSSLSCLNNNGSTIHELMHAIGFHHEQNRPDRDEYVQVLYENIMTGEAHNFEKMDATLYSTFDENYDYKSIMHYQVGGFSKNDKPTMKALKKTPEAMDMGQREGFSKADVRKINRMYKCKDRAHNF